MIAGSHFGQINTYPENTLLAQRAAVDAGAKLIQVPLQYTSDGVIVAMHDTTLTRTTNGTGNVIDTSWSTMSALYADKTKPQTGEARERCRVPRLSDILTEFVNDNVYIGIYPSVSGTPGINMINDTINAVVQAGMLDRCVIMASLNYAKRGNKWTNGNAIILNIDYLFSPFDNGAGVYDCVINRNAGMMFGTAYITKPIVDYLHSLGLLVAVGALTGNYSAIYNNALTYLGMGVDILLGDDVTAIQAACSYLGIGLNAPMAGHLPNRKGYDFA